MTTEGSVARRLQQELMKLMMSKEEGITAFPQGDSLLKWKGVIIGGKETPYNGLSYKLDLNFPTNYPFEPPHVTFEKSPQCFHPNVDQNGNICLDILNECWSACYNVKTLLLSIQSLLAEPNTSSPLNSFAAILWENPEEYEAMVKMKYNEKQNN